MVNLLVTQTIFLLTCFIMHVGGLKTGIKTVSKRHQFPILTLKNLTNLQGLTKKSLFKHFKAVAAAGSFYLSRS
jgi:hypothetical protein